MSQFIQVEFIDGAHARMAPHALDLCLRQGRIRSFRRRGGRVVVGIDPIRGTSPADSYVGPDRRSAS